MNPELHPLFANILRAHFPELPPAQPPTVDTECEVVETRIEKKEDELIGAFKQSIVNARTR